MANYPLSYQGPKINDLLGDMDNLGPATELSDGLMSGADKTKLNSIDANAQVNVLEGVKLGNTSLQPVEKVVTIPMDNEPSEDSPNLVSSGAVYSAIRQASHRQSTSGVTKVVAGRRIPKENWGDVPIRFSLKPTFIVRYHEVEEIEQGRYRCYAPIIARLITSGIVSVRSSTSSPSIEGLYEDYILFGQDMEEWIGHHESEDTIMYRLEYATLDTHPKNAIKLLSDGTFKLLSIITAQTCSPDLVIENGRIKCIATVSVDVEQHHNIDQSRSPLLVSLSRKCCVKYRRTGSQFRTSSGGLRVRRKKAWTFLHHTHQDKPWLENKKKVFVGPDCVISEQYFTRRDRKMIWAKFYPISRGRWVSVNHTEVHKVYLKERH